MSGIYLVANTPLAQLAVMVKSCMETYWHDHPNHRYMGFGPDYSFIESYLHDFFESKLDMARLEERIDQTDSRSKELMARIKRHEERVADLLRIPKMQI